MSIHIYDEEWFAAGARGRARHSIMPNNKNVHFVNDREWDRLHDVFDENHDIYYPKDMIPMRAEMLRIALLSDNISLNFALMELNNLALQTDFNDLAEWAECEVLGFSPKHPESLPDYRIFDCQTIILDGTIDGRECRDGYFERDMLPQEVLDVAGTIKFWNCLTDVERGIEWGGLVTKELEDEDKGEIYKKTDAVFKCNHVVQMILQEQLIAIADAVRERILQGFDDITDIPLW